MTLTVLLVDDEAHVTASLQATLAIHRESIDVLTAESGREGLELLRAHAVDVVVSDERMPEMSGSEFLTAVRSEFPEVMRIILTGQASIEATIAAINDAKVFRFLTKPCPTDDFLACVDDAIVARHALLAEAQAPTASEPDPLLDTDFSDALAGAHMAYQPILRASGEHVYGYEALLRSTHPQLPTAAALLDAAKRLGREQELDRRVRSLVAAEIPSAADDVAIFVNLCPTSLGDPSLTDGSDDLDRHADRIVLEITERAPLGDIDHVGDHLAALRGRGYRLALDDFGAGYNGLTSFATLQPDIVKFDMELIRDVDRSPTRSGIISSMATLCRDIGVLTVAEGIETAAEFRHLRALGCDCFQGFAIAKPGDAWVAWSMPT